MEIEFDRLVDALPGLVWAVTPDGRTQFVNARWCEVTGQAVARALEAGWSSALHPDDAAAATARWAQILAAGQADAFEARLRRRDGGYRRFQVQVRPVRSACGDVGCWCAHAMAVADEPSASREQQLWDFVDKLPTHFVFLSPRGEVQYVNRAIQDYYGRSLEELKGWTQSDALHPDERAQVVEAWAAAVAAGGRDIYDSTHRARRHDGVYRWMNARMFPYWDEAGDLVRWISLNTDVDDLKRTQLLLEGEVRILERLAREAPLAQVLGAFCQVAAAWADGSIAAVLIRDPTDGELHVAAAPEVTGDLEGVLNLPATRLPERDGGEGHDQDGTVVGLDALGDPQLAGSAWAARMRAQGLATCWVTPILSGVRQALGVFVLYRRSPGDPTDAERRILARFAAIAGIAITRAQTEAALDEGAANVRRAYELLAEAQKLSKTGSFITDIVADSHNWSDEAYRIFDFDPAGPVSLERIREVVHRDDLGEFDTMIAEATKGADADFHFRIVTAAGVLKHVRGIARVAERVTGRPMFVGALADVTESKLVEEALRASEAELRRRNAELVRAHGHINAAQRLSQTGSFIWDLEADAHYWSDELYRIAEVDPAAPIDMERVRACIHPDDRGALEAALAQAVDGSGFDYAGRLVTPSGGVKHFHIVGRRIETADDRLTFVGALQDVTERRAAEDALNAARADLARVSRVMALGALTASIAHEVNQPLAGIVANAVTCLQMVMADPPNLEGARTTVQRLVRDGNRAAEIVQRLRALFANKPPAFGAVDLNEAALEVLTLSSAELQTARVSVRTQLGRALPPVRGDRVQLQQVILNLMLNAADAMRAVEDRAREITLTTVHEGLDGVRLSVSDVGVGVDTQTVERLFEAFHTTKETGMGVGLAVSRSIIESHEGRLWAAANPGPGATFAFIVPAFAPGPSALSAPNPPSS